MVRRHPFRGQFESRMLGDVDEARKAGNIILSRELHNIMGAGRRRGRG
jgi:ATP-dependent Clp protease ATP-binding subunit ClpA